jgi:hypothetical protein
MANKKLVFTAEARNDIFEAIEALEAKSVHLSSDFLDDFWKNIASIEKNPAQNKKPSAPEIYYLAMENYTYKIVYQVNNAFIRVVAILGGETMPGKIQEALLKRKYAEVLNKSNAIDL